MFRSKEIRWFFKEENAQISNWFKERGLFFHSTRPRTDYYYVLVNSIDVGLKLREGKIEYKHKLNEIEDELLHRNAQGNFENWVKWSFNVEKGDVVQEIILGRNSPGSWIKVYKERVGVKVYNNKNKKSLFVNLGEHLDDGCQVEYTRIIVNGQEWHTFGLEYFGSKIVEPDTNLLDSLLGDTELGKQDAMSYPEFFHSEILNEAFLKENVVPLLIIK